MGGGKMNISLFLDKKVVYCGNSNPLYGENMISDNQ